MLKRKREQAENYSERSIQEPSATPPLRKSARLENKSRPLLPSAPVKRDGEKRTEKKRCRLFPSPSTSGSSRQDLLQNRAKESVNDERFNTHSGKTQSHTFEPAAGHKRKHKKEPGQIEPRKRHRKCESEKQRKPSKLSEDHFPKEQSVQFQEGVPETDSPIFERPEQGPEVLESEEKEEEKEDLISYWVVNHTWPDNFAESRAMSSSNNTSKRQRISDRSQSGKDEKSRSYSQSRKDGGVPQQYTKSYEKYIFTKGLDMDDFKGEKLVSPDSKVTCKDLQNITREAISPTVYSEAETLEVVKLCRNRNEAMVNRDITPLIVPPIKLLYFKDEVNQFEHFTDEVNTQWYESWVLAGPRPTPDLAVGFFSSAFTIAENEKLTNYTSFENLTRPTDDLCFPFLMCEVKCGNEGLDYADRQNMHSCSVAVKALLKLEQKADQYREDKQFESLLGKILVYSISHDQKNARLYGHFALVEGEKWTYYRHHIANFDIVYKEMDLLALHNFARNVLTVYAPKLFKRLQKAIAALPVSSTLSFSASTMNLEDDSQQGFQQRSQGRDAEGFATPVLSASTQKFLDEQKEQTNKLLQGMERQTQELKKEKDEQKEQTNKLLQVMERQMQELKKEKDEQKEQMNKLLQVMERQMQELKKEKEEQRSK